MGAADQHVHEAREGEREEEVDVERSLHGGEDADGEELVREGAVVQEGAVGELVHGAHDHGGDGGLDGIEGREDVGVHEAERDVQPREQQHEHEARQHEGGAGDDGADAAARQQAKVAAELGGLGARQHLVDGEHALELLRRDPLAVGHELLLHHGDLRRRPTPSTAAHPEEDEEQAPQREVRRVVLGAWVVVVGKVRARAAQRLARRLCRWFRRRRQHALRRKGAVGRKRAPRRRRRQ